MDALSERRVAPLCPAELDCRAARQSCWTIHASATLGTEGALTWDGHFLPAPVDTCCCPIKAQLWSAGKMAATCWSILHAKSGSAANLLQANLRNGRFWLRPQDKPC